MANSKQTLKSDGKPGTRYVWLTRYDIETGRDPEGSDAIGSTKNFPSTFIPMSELEEALAGE